MKIGIDLDGTLYSHPAFFAQLIEMTKHKWQFYCISSHGRDEWEKDAERLEDLGVPADCISPELMNETRHGHLHIKGAAADKCDLVFDDDVRLADFTKTPVFAPIRRAKP